MRLFCAMAAVSFASTGAVAQSVDGSAEEAEFAAWGVAYTGDVVAGVLGGLERDAAYLHNIDLTATLRFDAREGWRGPHVYMHVLGNHGRDPSGFVGDAQTVSNIATDPAWRLFELWVEQPLFRQRASALVGLYDLNSEFDVSHTGGLFMNSSFGTGAEFAASGENGPSIFPATALGARLRWIPTPGLYAQAAIVDGVPGDPTRPGRLDFRLSHQDGALAVAEIGLVLQPKPYGLDFVSRREDPLGSRRFAIGFWRYSGKFEQIDFVDSGRRAGSQGAYALAEKDLTPATRCYSRIGWADPRTNRFVGSWIGGCTHDGPLPARPTDVFGLAVSTAVNGNPYLQQREALSEDVTRTETVLEVAYVLSLSNYLSLLADVQCVLNPNTDAEIRDALLVSLRATLAF